MFSIIDPSILVAMIRKYWKVDKAESLRWYFSTLAVSLVISIIVNASDYAGLAFDRFSSILTVSNAFSLSSVAFVIFFVVPIGAFMKKLVFGKYSGVNIFNVNDVLGKIDFKKSKVAQNANIAVFCFFQTVVFSAVAILSKLFTSLNSDSPLSFVYDFTSIFVAFVLMGIFYAGCVATVKTLKYGN